MWMNSASSPMVGRIFDRQQPLEPFHPNALATNTSAIPPTAIRSRRR